MIQAYLYRSEQDIQDLLAYGCRIRLCKGAYKEPPEVAFPKKEDVDAQLRKIDANAAAQRRLSRNRDARSEDDCARPFALPRRNKISKDDFEFQMLYGVRTDLQRRLVSDGFRVAHLHSLRPGLVSLFHAAAGRTPRKPGIFRTQFLPVAFRLRTAFFGQRGGIAA